MKELIFKNKKFQWILGIYLMIGTFYLVYNIKLFFFFEYCFLSPFSVFLSL